MTRRKPTRAEREKLQRSHEVASRAQAALGRRGFFVPMAELDRLSFNDCLNAESWARNDRPAAVMPTWLAHLVESGVAYFLSERRA